MTRGHTQSDVDRFRAIEASVRDGAPVSRSDPQIRGFISFYHGTYAVYGPRQNCRHAVCQAFWDERDRVKQGAE